MHVDKCQRFMMKEGTQKYVQISALSLSNAAIWYLYSDKLHVNLNSEILSPQEVVQEIST